MKEDIKHQEKIDKCTHTKLKGIIRKKRTEAKDKWQRSTSFQYMKSSYLSIKKAGNMHSHFTKKEAK